MVKYEHALYVVIAFWYSAQINLIPLLEIAGIVT